MHEDAPSRINVSRDALRAELAEMELRLRIYFDDQLRHKANETDVLALQIAAGKLERGEFTVAQALAIDDRVEAMVGRKTDQEWTRRDRIMAVLSIATAIATLSISVLLAAHGGGGL